MRVIQTLQSNRVTVYYQPQLAPPRILIRPEWLLAPGEKRWLPFLLIDAYAWLERPTIVVQSSNPTQLPETSFSVIGSNDYAPWELAATPSIGGSGTATLILSGTNYSGLGTNVTVQVQVVPLAAFNGDCLDSPGLAWSIGGKPAWIAQTVNTHDGAAAAQSGAENGWLQTTVTGPGILKFWFKLASEYYYSNGQFRTRYARDGITCLECHMPVVNAPSVAGGADRTRRSHRFLADKDRATLEHALHASLDLVEAGRHGCVS